MILHAGLIAARVGRLWRGVLITGSSGAGKSDLMLRALDAGFRLVADDRTLVWTSAGRLFGRAPDTLRGLIELRGVGVLPERPLPFAEIALVIRCEEQAADRDRIPEPEFEEICGAPIPLLRAHALDASAPAKIGRALIHLGHGSRAS
jgi:serine kinase of HPr protein (carbohydrate metabolism regulator)